MFTLNMKASGRYETPAELDPLTQLKNVVSGMATKLATLEKNESPCAQHAPAAIDAVKLIRRLRSTSETSTLFCTKKKRLVTLGFSLRRLRLQIGKIASTFDRGLIETSVKGKLD